jgi:hypothetical protein
VRSKEHWERIRSTKDERDLSWFESLPQVSLELFDHAVGDRSDGNHRRPRRTSNTQESRVMSGSTIIATFALEPEICSGLPVAR